MGGNIVETLIGAVVLAVAGLFLVYAYSAAGVGSSMGGYELIAKFDRVDGLPPGADVRMSGIKVGNVVSQSLDPKGFRAVVRFTLQPDVQLPDDSAAKISSTGLLGDSYLSLEPGGSDTPLKPGQELRFTQGAVNLMDLIGQAMFGAAGAGVGAPPKATPQSLLNN